ncbi:hypothetical protein E308F_29670 [Moorella sp. E308F]|uniref:hypothetical protein n=1 Tax=Moorella sp. E308F TaxID=2572682 RepID=UPI0010FFB56C|nr:hypothetical protein [Moorella sp. E308F]GEA16721.1 hypothetical protein E308F_29670 [Moorella sp. E308F]
MFYQEVDKRNREAMISFLRNHFRYHTMNSWNNATSYANCVKIYKLNLPEDIKNKAWDMLDMDEVYFEINSLLEDWAAEHDYQWQVGFNGRSGGYLVLYQGGWKYSSYKSYCTRCGQKNFQPASEGKNQCGRCGAYARVNYKTPPKEIFTYPGKGVDMYEDFEVWDMESLRDRVKLVQSFDKLCDEVRDLFIDICRNYIIEEKEILVPKKIRVLKEA